MRVLFVFKTVQFVLCLSLLILILIPTPICFPGLKTVLPLGCGVAFSMVERRVTDPREGRTSEETRMKNRVKCFFPSKPQINDSDDNVSQGRKDGPRSIFNAYFCVQISLRHRYCSSRKTHPGDPEFCLDQRMFLVPTILIGGVGMFLSLQLVLLHTSKNKKYMNYCSNLFCTLFWLVAVSVFIFKRMEWHNSWRQEWISWNSDPSIGAKLNSETPLYPVPWSLALFGSVFLFIFHLLEVALPTHWHEGNIRVIFQRKETFELQNVIP